MESNRPTPKDPRQSPTRGVDAVALFTTSETAPAPVRYRVCGFTLETGGGHDARWRVGGETVDPHMAIARVIGAVALGDPMPCVGGPGGEVRVGTMGRDHRKRMAVLPTRQWTDLGGGVWCSHDGRRLSVTVTSG